jgi:hypothetical protein
MKNVFLCIAVKRVQICRKLFLAYHTHSKDLPGINTALCADFFFRQRRTFLPPGGIHDVGQTGNNNS